MINFLFQLKFFYQIKTLLKYIIIKGDNQKISEN